MTGEPWDDTDTNTLCARDPHLEAMRQLVLKLERDAHQRGWDHEDNQNKLFEVMRGDDLLGLRMAGVLQVVFDELCDERDGNVGLALLNLAQISEMAREYMGVDAGSDLYAPALEGAVVYGWGLLSEVWLVHQSKDATPEQARELQEAGAEHRLSQRPDRIEARLVYLVCRDGNYWAVMRERGKPAVAVVTKPESLALEAAGNVPHALGRIVDSIVNNPVPVPGRG